MILSSRQGYVVYITEITLEEVYLCCSETERK